MSPGYDVVVVGGGSAGSALAARLSEDPTRSVLLLEAGAAPRSPAEFPPELLDAGTVRGAVPRGPDNWTFTGRLARGRDYETTRGRILGGSSTINGAYFIRPRVADFARWAAQDAPAWRYESVLPLLVRMERDTDFGATPVHGGDGPIGVGRARAADPASEVFATAAAALGFPAEPDKNDQAAPGVGPVPTNAVGGVRQNSALAYLLPVLDRPNLTVLGGALACRVLFDGARAVGVEYLTDGELRRVAADEVVLSAGALKSPQLLLLSGIGPQRELRRLGIRVRLDAPRVGAAFGDHPQWVLGWRPARPAAAPPHAWLSLALHTETVEVLPSLRPMAALLGAPAAADAPLPLLVSAMTPRNGGRLRLLSADPAAQPLLDYGYLADAGDRERARDAVTLALELLGTGVWRAASLDRSRVPVGREPLDRWIAEHLGSSMHSVGTVPFGGADAPVDQFGVVRGVEGLRVADASILPSAPLRGPAVAAVLVGELVADAMRRGG